MARSKDPRSTNTRRCIGNNRVRYDEEIDDRCSRLSPEQKLLFALLFTAIRDMKLSDRAPEKRAARVWFISDRTGPFSFLWVTDFLDIEPGKVRKRLAELTPKELRTLISEQRTRVYYDDDLLERIGARGHADRFPFVM